MAKRKKSQMTPEELEVENGFLRLKIMAEFGMYFSVTEFFPAEYENLILRKLLQIQQVQHTAPKVTVYERIGEPLYNHVHDMSDQEIKRELKRLLNLMAKKRITVSVNEPVLTREIYRYVTEEVFKKMVEVVRLRWWTNHFVYEDDHPNTAYNIKNTVRHFMLTLIFLNFDFLPGYLAEDVKGPLGLTSDPEAIGQMVKDYLSTYYDWSIASIAFPTLEIDESDGTAWTMCKVTLKTKKELKKRATRTVLTFELFLKQVSSGRRLWFITRFIADFL